LWGKVDNLMRRFPIGTPSATRATNAVIKKFPLSFEMLLRATPVSTFVAVTLAPGTTDPD
jgi:hypothetical protein